VFSKQRVCLVRIVSAFAFCLAVLAGSAQGADLNSQLSEAESRLSSAQADVASAEAALAGAREDLTAASQRAKPMIEAARSARADERALRESLTERQQQAKVRIQELEAAHGQEVDDRDQEIATGIGIGLAALVAAGIALAWNRFRNSAAVAALSRIDLAQALGLCLGGGFLLVVVGAALNEAGGAPGALGIGLFCLGFILPTAFLLGRHSVRVQRGQSKPALRRDRLPGWVSRGVAVLLLLLALGGLSSSIFTEEPAALSLSAQLQEDSTALERGPGADELEEAEVETETAREAAQQPLAQRQATRAAARKAAGELRRANNILVRAVADQRRFSRRLAALVAREEREAAKAAARAEREAEEVAEEAAEEESFSSTCDSNYSGCVPAYPPDVDCAEVGETVTVLGADPHGLDADSDLVGCE
jgi:hypothetical protein